jgi:hypothetical protein
MCCKGKNKQGQYRPWECVVKVKTNKGNTEHGNVFIALVCFYLYNTFPWSVLPLFVLTFTTHSYGLYCPCLFLPLQHIPMSCIALVCFYLYNTFPWSVLPLFVFTFTTHSHGLYCPCLFLPLQHIPMVCIALVR